MSLQKELSSILEGDVIDDIAARELFSRDASLFKVTPSLIIAPKHTGDIQALVQYINKHPEKHISITARSGGTCMSGGSLTTSVVLDMQKYMHNFLRLGSDYAVTQPGIFYRDFEKETLVDNLLLPSYPASREICTVGGMINNNSGGEKTLRYGKTENYIKQLQVVLQDGKEYTIEPLTLRELQQKMKLKTFEGTFYTKMVELIDKNENIIDKAKPHVSKNSTGYNLWNVWNGDSFDLTQLFTGSQGTLGITTQVTLRLITPEPKSKMLIIFLRELDSLAQLVQSVLRYNPESFESYDDHTLALAIKYLPQMARQMGGTNVFSLALKFLPELKLVMAGGGLPKLILMAEFTGHNIHEITKRARAAQASLDRFRVATHITRDEKESKKYWTIRRESFNLLRKKLHNKHTAPFIDDLIVRPDQLPTFLPKLNEILSHYSITYTIAGHIGDANFHIIPLMDLTNEKNREIIPELAEKVYDLVFSYGGSMSGEHNDGLIRSHFLKQMYGPEVYDLFVQTKQIFDPNNIFNPGKKVNSDWKFALDHMVRT